MNIFFVVYLLAYTVVHISSWLTFFLDIFMLKKKINTLVCIELLPAKVQIELRKTLISSAINDFCF